MARIKRLSPDTTGKIAAGEIIERPVNVVKELTENALDAAATRINIDIENGGKSYIKVSDNGIGIPCEEIELAVENFSTSKISNIEDIMRIKSLGFRGEALASIRSVSRLEIVSRTQGEDMGRVLSWRGAEILEDNRIAREPGTEITVSDLFFNLPARKKFLSSSSSESRRITGLIQGYALAFPEVGFALKSNGNETLHYPASSMDERVEVVFGTRVFSNLKYFESNVGHLTISGYTSLPELTRGNRSMQHIYINRRAIKDRVLGHALRQAYTSLIPSDRFPIIILFIEIPPDEIDVNVHPTKSEVRFQNERELHNRVVSVLRETLQGKTISFSEKVESVYKTIFPSGDRGENTTSEHGQTPSREMPESLYQGDEATGQRSEWLFRESPDSLFTNSHETQSSTVSGGLYWQLHQSYIFIQIRGGMVIIDQHAAHERILYNQAKNNLSGEKPVVQSLLFPATLELTHEEFDNFDRLAEQLPLLGFDVEPFGQKSIIIRGIPAGVRNWSDGKLLQDILAEKGVGRNSIDDFLRTYACRSAVKAGDKLSNQEMETLTDQLFATDFPFSCPHGRPTILRVGLEDLDKRFHRTSSRKK